MLAEFQNATRRVLPYLLPRKTLQSGSARALLVDILSGAVLQPVFDLLADPDTINLILEVAFDPEPSKKFPPASGETVEFLAAFVNSMSPMQRPPSVKFSNEFMTLDGRLSSFLCRPSRWTCPPS